MFYLFNNLAKSERIGYIFINPETGLPYKSIKKSWKSAVKVAGIENFMFHDLRHTYASLLLANGAPMKYVQHQLGHSSITMTMDLYTHLLPEVNDKCVNLLNNIVNTTVETNENIREFGT